MFSVGLITALTMGASACPSESGVESYLRRSTPPEARARYQWSVSVDGRDMKLTLVDANGGVVRVRSVPAAGTCSERESVAAVVLGAWMMAPPSAPAPAAVASPAAVPAPPPAATRPAIVDARPAAAGRPSVPPSGSPAASPDPRASTAAAAPTESPAADGPAPRPATASPTAGSAPADAAPADTARADAASADAAPTADIPPRPPEAAPTPRVTGSAPPPPARVTDANTPAPTLVASAAPELSQPQAPPGTSGAPPSLTETHEAAPVSAPAAWRFDIALDLRAQYAATAAPGLGLMASAGRSFGVFLELSSALPRTQTLGLGQAHWWRVALGAGARYRAELSWLWLEPALSVEGAWVQASGEGFVNNTSAGGFDASVCAQLRAGRAVTGPLHVYLGARGCVWPLNNQLAVTGPDQSLPMPRFELGALLGISLGFPVKGSGPSRPEGT